jgi:hypothetical protein
MLISSFSSSMCDDLGPLAADLVRDRGSLAPVFVREDMSGMAVLQNLFRGASPRCAVSTS